MVARMGDGKLCDEMSQMKLLTYASVRPMMQGMSTTYRLTITTADGRSWSFDRAKMPRHWKSWLMQQVPYGTPMQGAQFKREPAEA
jgi:hypothetical protein